MPGAKTWKLVVESRVSWPPYTGLPDGGATVVVVVGPPVGGVVVVVVVAPPPPQEASTVTIATTRPRASQSLLPFMFLLFVILKRDR